MGRESRGGCVLETIDQQLGEYFKALHMPHARRAAGDILQSAKTQRWHPVEVIKAVLECEVEGRRELGIARRLKTLGVPGVKTLETFAAALSTIPTPTLDYLSTLEWVSNKENLVIAGPSGTGKSHLIAGLARKVIEEGGRAVWLTMDGVEDLVLAHQIDHTLEKRLTRLTKTDLIVIDDIGLLPVSEHGAQGLYRIVESCYEKVSIALSTNVHPAKFDQLMPINIATATVDRLMHHAHVVQTQGDSIRMSQALAGQGVKNPLQQ